MIVIVYMHHAGNNRDELHSVYNKLHVLFEYRMQTRFYLTVRNDFNVEVIGSADIY